MKVSVLSLGGSIIAPDGVDSSFLVSFVNAVKKYLNENPGQNLVLVCGGGAPARKYQQALREVSAERDPQAEDWIGIRATHLNAELVKAAFGSFCKDPVVVDPSDKNIKISSRVLVAGGWKPGFSTDADAVCLAKHFNSSLVVNLSNIKKVYTEDPKKNPNAVALDSISWQDFRKMVGDVWEPGKNVPFDPIASKEAQGAAIKVVCADGRNIENLLEILSEKSFEGTVIG